MKISKSQLKKLIKEALSEEITDRELFDQMHQHQIDLKQKLSNAVAEMIESLNQSLEGSIVNIRGVHYVIKDFFYDDREGQVVVEVEVQNPTGDYEDRKLFYLEDLGF